MNIASWFTGGIDKVVDSVGNAIDKLVTSDEEREILKNEIEKVRIASIEKAMLDATEFEKEITKRWLSDNDHLITRLVRPISFISVLVLFGAVVVSDGNIGEFTINPAYIPVLETLLITMVVAYFGSRGAEKITKAMK